jgi:hypothetical protein
MDHAFGGGSDLLADAVPASNVSTALLLLFFLWALLTTRAFVCRALRSSRYVLPLCHLPLFQSESDFVRVVVGVVGCSALAIVQRSSSRRRQRCKRRRTRRRPKRVSSSCTLTNNCCWAHKPYACVKRRIACRPPSTHNSRRLPLTLLLPPLWLLALHPLLRPHLPPPLHRSAPPLRLPHHRLQLPPRH